MLFTINAYNFLCIQLSIEHSTTCFQNKVELYNFLINTAKMNIVSPSNCGFHLLTNYLSETKTIVCSSVSN